MPDTKAASSTTAACGGTTSSSSRLPPADSCSGAQSQNLPPSPTDNYMIDRDELWGGVFSTRTPPATPCVGPVHLCILDRPIGTCATCTCDQITPERAATCELRERDRTTCTSVSALRTPHSGGSPLSLIVGRFIGQLRSVSSSQHPINGACVHIRYILR